MTATDELRRLLDGLGVEYETEDRPTIRYTDWGDWVFSEPMDAKPHTLGAQCELMRIPATPEQAVEATLGSDLKAENAKLRELLSELYESAWLEYQSAFEHTFGERLRKLGIEVDA